MKLWKPDWNKKRRRTAMLKSYVGKPCPYCGRPMMYLSVESGKYSPTRDHVHVVKSKGGCLEGSNALIVCGACNVDKSDRSLSDWVDYLMSVGDARANRVAEILQSISQ